MKLEESPLEQMEEPEPPCKHMEAMLNRAADGSGPKLSRWYALAHATHCGRCERYLKFLENVLARLRLGKEEPPDDTMERLKKKIAGLEK